MLDTIDPRSRLGRPLDFREFLPRIAWLGLNPDPGELVTEVCARRRPLGMYRYIRLFQYFRAYATVSLPLSSLRPIARV